MNVPQLSYAICCTPRSGSWLLSEGLASTGIAGNPREWFNKQEENRVRVLAGSEPTNRESYLVYLQHVFQLGTTSNGVWGIKLHYDQFECLPDRFVNDDSLTELPASTLLPRLFPNLRYIWLTRKDKSRQALSHYRALQTDEWWKIDGIEPPRRVRISASSTLDCETVVHLERLLVRYDEDWFRFFESMGVAPLAICYEDLAADYANVVRSVLNWLAIPDANSIQPMPPRLVKQADLQTDKWLCEYQEFKSQISISSPKQFDETWRRWAIEKLRDNCSLDSLTAIMLQNGFGKLFSIRTIKTVSQELRISTDQLRHEF